MLNLRSIFKKEKPEYRKFEKISYSQSGEDLLIDYIFRLRGITKPSYLDLGANHPFSLNNTFLFYQRGATGVNIDANPALIKLFEHYRPLDKNINLGVGELSGQMDFYVFDNDALSTFSDEEAEKLEALGRRIVEKVPVPIKNVNVIISDYFGGIYPDFLSIDVEGFDEIIVQTLNFEKSKPKVICLETVEYTTDGTGKKRRPLIEMVLDLGFTVYADTNINTVFVENKFWFGV